MRSFFNDTLTNEQLEKLFSDPDHCLEYIASLKWGDAFVCRKCGNENYCPGKAPYSRRCTRCKQEESATAGTIFHNCKFPINKAFFIAYHVCKSKEQSSYEFAKKLSIRQMTCWSFKKKISDALSRLQQLPAGEQERATKLFDTSTY